MIRPTNILQEPRQFVPPEGHSFTSIKRISEKHKNRFETDPIDPRIISIFSEPQFAIGQRAVLIQTAHGNILWDCISLLDQDTIDFIKSRGGLKAIAISHPHFYSSHLQWAREFDCPVYLAREDEKWVNRVDVEGRRIFVDTPTLEILPGATFVKLGGHFPGSSMLHWSNKIFVGDSIGVSLSGLNREHHEGKHQVFFFQYAFPNFVPLGPTAMRTMWKRLLPWDFEAVYSLFWRTTVREPDVKQILLKSMKRQARAQENDEHPLLRESYLAGKRLAIM
jgi:hypothetical protein